MGQYSKLELRGKRRLFRTRSFRCSADSPLFYGVPRASRSLIDSVVSVVALNFQTPGEQMDLHQGRFLPNGRCGYVLKPSFLCSPTSNFNPENTGGGPGHVPTQLTVRVSVGRE